MSRDQFTDRLIAQLEKSTSCDVDAANELWWDPRPQGGYRLTDIGFKILSRNISMHHWQFNIDDNVITPRNLLSLDRYLTCPYFLRKHRRSYHLILFGAQESTMASLYGDTGRFIASLEP